MFGAQISQDQDLVYTRHTRKCLPHCFSIPEEGVLTQLTKGHQLQMLCINGFSVLNIGIVLII